MRSSGMSLQATSRVMDVAARLGVHAHTVVRWNVVLPVLVAILFFGAFTTVYILMRRPSFGEHGVTHDVVRSPDVVPVTSPTS
jgi:hypothetical protein